MRSDSRERFVGSRKFMLCYVMVVRSGPGRAIHGVHAMAHAVSLKREQVARPHTPGGGKGTSQVILPRIDDGA